MQTRRFVFVLVRVPSDDVIAWLDENIQLVCAESAVKFNIWDVVSVVLSLTRNILDCDQSNYSSRIILAHIPVKLLSWSWIR